MLPCEFEGIELYSEAPYTTTRAILELCTTLKLLSHNTVYENLKLMTSLEDNFFCFILNRFKILR